MSLRKSDFIMSPWVHQELSIWNQKKGEGILIGFDSYKSWAFWISLDMFWLLKHLTSHDLIVSPAWEHMENLGNAGGHMDTQPPPTTSNLTQTTTFAQREAFIYCFNLDVGSSAWPECFCSPSCVYFCECFEQYFPILSTYFYYFRYVYDIV